MDVVEGGTPGAGDAERLRKAAHRQALNMAAASTPGHEDANFMTAAISFFVLLGTIGYWMFLRSKAAKENEKALLQGAKDGDTHRVASLIKAGTDVGCKDGDGMTALMLACANKNEAAAALLMEATQKAGALDVQGGDKQSSALHYASVNGWESAVAKLLSLGADAALRDKDGKTALILFLAKSEAFSSEATAVLLMEATQKAGALDVQGALHIAIRRGWESAVAKLLSLGADAGLKDGDGMTALMLACANKNESVAVLVMEATQKAGPPPRSVSGRMFVSKPTYVERPKYMSAGRLFHSERKYQSDKTHVASTQVGALDVQDGRYQRSALHYASVNGWESAVAKLLSLGADAALKDKVRACSYMNTCMYSVDVCMFVNVLLIRISLSIMHHIFIIVCASHIYIMLVKGIHTRLCLSRLFAHDSLDEHNVCVRFTHDNINMILFRYMLCISYTR